MLRTGMFIALATTTFASARAQVVPLRVTTRECSIYACNEFIVSGSAVFLGRGQDNGYVFLTAAHNLTPISSSPVVVESQQILLGVDGLWVPATHVRSRRAQGIDLALLKVHARVPLIQCLPVREKPAEVNAGALLAGYPEGGGLRVTKGQIVQTNFLYYPLAVNQRPLHGESGGAVVVDGQLEGIISSFPATDRPLCLYSNANVIREFLRKSMKQEPICRPIKSDKE